jgi:enamine deaminase RidA (YjgF/YER057c/UK114 family)
MQRTPVNPWEWSKQFGYNQAEIVEGSKRQLICSGQTSVDGEGNLLHADIMRDQITLALSNLESVLAGADMGLGDVIRLSVFTTDVDEAMKHFDVLGMSFGAANNMPPMTLLGVTRLAIPGMMFEIEATAAD